MKLCGHDIKTILAPMAAVNCASFRLICKENGADLVTTPMIAVNSINENVIKRIYPVEKERPLSVQLVGSDPELIASAAQQVNNFADVIDFNMGCPESDILALRAGSYFVKHPEKITKAMKSIIDNTNKPVTAKIRTGWDTPDTEKIVKILDDIGVDAIAIHARTKKQGYTGTADWNEIKIAKGLTEIPIIGNGDINKPGMAKAMIDQTGCDAVMIGRGAVGNPFIFSQINYLFGNGHNCNPPTQEEKINAFLKFMEYYERYENNRSESEVRQHAMWFTKSMKGAKGMRRILMKSSIEEIRFLRKNVIRSK